MLTPDPRISSFPAYRKPRRWQGAVLALVALAGIVAAALVPRVAQDPGYHQFADARHIAGVPNFWNVFSNLGFLLVGGFALVAVCRMPAAALRLRCIVFCLAVLGVGLGSSWYHLAPSTPALVWDRLPMSVAFMALFCLVLGDRVSWRLANRLSWPLMLIGAASVLYWYWTETRGVGDLRPYGLVQFLPMLLMPLLLLAFPGSRGSAGWLWLTALGYGLAKLAEHFDAAIYAAIGLSGHSIKHMLSAAAVMFAVLALLRLETHDASRIGWAMKPVR